MRRVGFSPAARRDLASITLHLKEQAGSGIASEVIRRIREKCRLLAETPGEIGTPRPELFEGIRSFPVPPHVLFFRYSQDRVQIARILHQRQDVDRHLPA